MTSRARRGAVLLTIALVAGACTGGHDESAGDGPGSTAPPVEATTSELFPTNQWWSSALAGDFTETMWVHPLIVRADADGLALGGARDTLARADVIEVPFVAGVRVGGPLEAARPTSYGSHSVELTLDRTGGEPVTVQLAQGTPVATFRVPAGVFQVEVLDPDPISRVPRSVDGELTEGVPTVTDHLSWGPDADTWDLGSDTAVSWTLDGSTLRADVAEPTVVALAPRPRDADESWLTSFTAATHDPVLTTADDFAVDWDRGIVRHTLQWEHDGAGGGPVALLPHHRSHLTSGPPALAGGYDAAVGALSLVTADELVLEYPLTGFLPDVPAIELGEADEQAVREALPGDASEPSNIGGSYFGPKSLGRVALLAQLADAVGVDDVLDDSLLRLEAGLADWATMTDDDDRWLAHDPEWGGVIGHPSEFGNDEYNDHHFQFGYLIAAAATLLELADEPRADSTAADTRAAIEAWTDALVADVLGDPTGGTTVPFRVFNAYEGHSYASGFAPFGSGNNQESSSEAAHAWEAIARWALVTGDHALADEAIARWVSETATAVDYWLGATGRPDGFDHQTAGIVWGGKIDFATFFDPRPEAVVGIQLLPFTFASLYRSHTDVTTRVAEVTADGTIDLWPDLFAMELAMVDPAAARAIVAADDTIEEGNSLSLVRYWIAAMETLGTPSQTVRAGSPFGQAFDGPDATLLVATNPTTAAVEVTFRDVDGVAVGTVSVEPGDTVTRVCDACQSP